MSTATVPDSLLSTAEAAEILGVKATTMACWRWSGRYNLPFVKVGNAVKYRRSDLEKWLTGRSFTSTDQADAAGI